MLTALVFAAREGDLESAKLLITAGADVNQTTNFGWTPLLTAVENLILGVKLSEYHTGYRAFSRRVLTELPLLENSDDFVFDNQMLAQCVYFGFRVGEVSCPTKYFEEASSINFGRSVKYGVGVLATTVQFALQKLGLIHLRRFSPEGRKLESASEGYYASGARTAGPV